MKKTQNRIISPHAGWRLCLYVMLVMFASCSACKKTGVDALPPETQEGKNTFGCLVDGKAWIPNGGSGWAASRPISGGYRSALPPVYSNATNVWLNTYKDNETISFYVRNVNMIGTYPLNFDTQPKPASLYPQNYGGMDIRLNSFDEENYITTRVYTGSVEITRADSVNRIVSGRFSFTGVSSTGKTIKVTDGRFDLNSRTQ